jgi:adenosylhomocysteine nucleosidase
MTGIISAMQEEIQALLHELQQVTTTEKGMRTYYTGTLFGKKSCACFFPLGKSCFRSNHHTIDQRF